MAAGPADKLQTLRTRQDFRIVYDQGLKFHSPFFATFVLPTGGPAPRVGITVTRKLGGAVVRNRCKRRIREILRRQQNLALKGLGCDIVINARTAMLSADFKQLEESLARTLARVRQSVERAVN
jgi:ribonuclease P protein component